jgi:hypothetical protein
MRHSFKTSLSKEAQFIKEERHLPVLKQLNKELASEHKVKLDPETYKEYYGNSKEEKEKNKLGIDADCDIISSETGKIVKEAFAIDYKIRFKAYQPLDFLAEIISVDWNNTPGWAVDPNKETNGYVYIIEPIKKAIFVIHDELKNALDSGKFSDIKEKKASNRGYNTISIPIRIDRLKKECPTTLIFNYE